MTTYELLLYGALVVIVVGLPALDVFLNWLYPLSPEQEDIRRASIDRRRRYDNLRRNRAAPKGPSAVRRKAADNLLR
jgi:hypothetical protein